MRLIYKSFFYKAASVFRFLILRLYYLNKLSAPRLSMIGKRCGFYIQGKGNVSCKGRIILNDNVMIQSKGILELGSELGVNSFSRIVAHEKITIGDHVTIGQMVGILDHDHDFSITQGNLKLDGYKTAPIKIGNNVWIGDKCTILKGVTVGDNVVIGTNTLVNKDVPNNCIIGGVPFKILREL